MITATWAQPLVGVYGVIGIIAWMQCTGWLLVRWERKRLCKPMLFIYIIAGVLCGVLWPAPLAYAFWKGRKT